MFQAPPLQPSEAIVAPAQQPERGDTINGGVHAEDFLKTIAEQERISQVRDQGELLKILEQPGTPSAILTTTLSQLNRFADERALDSLEKFVLNSKNSEASRIQAFSAIASVTLDHPESRPVLGKVLTSILTNASEPENLRASAGFFAILNSHPEAKGLIKEGLSNPKADTSLRLLAASTDPVAGMPIFESIASNPKATVNERSHALMQQALLDPKRAAAIQDLVTNPSASEDLRYALLYHASNKPGLLPNETLIKVALEPAFSTLEQNRAVSVLSGRAEAKDAPALRKLAEGGINALARHQVYNALASLGLPEDQALMTSLSSNPRYSATALRYFSKADPEHAREIAREAIKSDWNDGKLEDLQHQAMITLASLGNDSDIEQVVSHYGNVAEAGFLGTSSDRPCARILDALGRSGRIGALERIETAHTESGYSMTLAKARAGSDTAVNALKAYLTDRQEHSQIIKAMIDSPAPSATQFLYHELSGSSFESRRVISSQLSEASAFNRFVRGLEALGGEAEHYADNLIRAKAVGIEHPFRFRPADLSHIVESRLSQTGPKEGEKQALLVVPRSDWNGAFNNLWKDVAGLRSQGYRVVLFEAADENEVVAALKGNAHYGSSDLVVLAAHGSPRAMSFGGLDPGTDQENDETKLIDLTDRDQLLADGVRAALKNNGRVILESCSTGGTTPDGKNLVRFFREIFPQAAELGIVGPTSPVMLNGFIFDDKGKLKEPDWGWVRPLHAQANDPWELWRVS